LNILYKAWLLGISVVLGIFQVICSLPTVVAAQYNISIFCNLNPTNPLNIIVIDDILTQK
jgi:hypothetical protein